MKVLKTLLWVFGIGFFLACFFIAACGLNGCAALDKGARATTRVSGDPVIRELAAPIPWADTALSLVNTAALIVLGVSQKVQASKHKDLVGKVKDVSDNVADAVKATQDKV